MIMDKLKKEFASKLLKVKAIKLQPNDPFLLNRSSDLIECFWLEVTILLR